LTMLSDIISVSLYHPLLLRLLNLQFSLFSLFLWEAKPDVTEDIDGSARHRRRRCSSSSSSDSSNMGSVIYIVASSSYSISTVV